MDEKMYQEELLEHFRKPKNNILIDDPDFYAEEKNPSCGDELAMTGKISGDVLVGIGFQGRGCVISQATASMLAEQSIGKKNDDLLALTPDDITQLIGITLGPVRLRCALLALQVLQQGIVQFEKNKKIED